MKKINCLLLLAALLLLGGCDNTDDVTAIFLGKTWKLTGIFDGSGTVDFWPTLSGEDKIKAQNEADALKNKEGNCVLAFTEGVEDGNNISGTFNAKGIGSGSNVSGTWSANGKNNQFSASFSGGSDSNVIGNNFLIGLRSADEYSGDIYNLKIHYTTADNQRRYLLFRRLN